MNRFIVLDGLRGYFLMFMVINHLDFQGGSLIVRINHAELGFVQDAQGFVFLSGMLVGLYYTRLYQKGRAQEGAAKIVRRAGELYRYAVLLLASIMAVALVMPQSQAFWGHRLGIFYEDAASVGVASALLLYQPTYMDILPQYIVYLLASPLLIRLVTTGYWREVALGSFALWLAAQLGVHLPLIAGLEHAVRVVAPGFELRSHFNPLGWQIIFVSGLLIGAAQSMGQFDRSRWFSAERTGMAWCALALVLFFLAWRLAFTNDLVPEVMAQRFWGFGTRTDFGLLFLLNFAALAYLIAWLLMCGQEAAGRAVPALSVALRRLFSHPFLVLLGQHSLQVYVFHVFLVYAIVALEWRVGPFNEIQKTMLALIAVASLALPALLRARWTRAPSASGRRAQARTG
jgi:hypothetical protein